MELINDLISVAVFQRRRITDSFRSLVNVEAMAVIGDYLDTT